MAGIDLAFFDLALLCFALTAAVLAGALLAIEFLASRRLAQFAPGGFAAVLAAAGLLGWLVTGVFWIAAGGAALAILLLAAWPLCFEVWRHHARRLLAPKSVWMLVLCASLIASRYLAAHVLRSTELPTAQAVEIEDVPVHTKVAVTDLGRSLPLFHFKLFSTRAEVEKFMRETEANGTQLIRMAEPNPAANCHGWVFAGGTYGIRDQDVPTILADNGYEEVSEAREGDIAVYSTDTQVAHSGLVRLAQKHEPVLIESKWGPFGVYLHAVDRLPFPGVCKFYRSQRAGHSLVLRSIDAATARVVAGQPGPVR